MLSTLRAPKERQKIGREALRAAIKQTPYKDKINWLEVGDQIVPVAIDIANSSYV